MAFIIKAWWIEGSRTSVISTGSLTIVIICSNDYPNGMPSVPWSLNYLLW